MAALDYVGGAIPGKAGIGNMLDSFLHPEKGYKKAGEQQEKYYKDAQGNLQPYNQNGQDQYGRLNDQANQLNDPAALQNKWAAGYEESPYAKQMEGQAKEAGMGAASSMGLMGSSSAVNNIQQSSHDIMQSDRQQYMNDLMNKYTQSIGIGQNLYGQGQQAAGQMSQNSMNQGTAMGNIAYGQQNAPGQLFGRAVGAAGQAGLNYMTGGASGAAKAATQ